MKRNAVFQAPRLQIGFGVAVALTLLTLLFVPTSAASPKMPLNPKADSIDTSAEGIVVLVFQLESKVKKKLIPRVGTVHVHDQEGKVIAKFRTKAPNGFSRAKGDMLSPVQVISIQLPSGRYTIRKVRGYGIYKEGINRGYPQGKWGFDLDRAFDIEAGKVFYLGRVNGAIVKKQDREGDSVARASVPLLDVAIGNVVTGFSGSALEVEQTGAYDEDMVMLEQRYPWLDTASIVDVSGQRTERQPSAKRD